MKCIECEKEIENKSSNKIYKLSADVYCSLKCLWKSSNRQTAHSIEICTIKQAYEDESVGEIQEALFGGNEKWKKG